MIPSATLLMGRSKRIDYASANLLNSGSYDGYIGLSGTTPWSMSTGALTVEAWIYRAATSASDIFSFGYLNINAPVFYVNGSDHLGVSDSVNNHIIGNDSVPTGQWVHVAWTRDGTNSRLFINGTIDSVGAVADTKTITGVSGEVRVGTGGGASGFQVCRTYIDELLVVKGAALYTASFTPPTQPYNANHAQYSNFSCLLHMDGTEGNTTFVDSGPNTVTCTAGNNAFTTKLVRKFS